jgi:hypothetical protein
MKQLRVQDWIGPGKFAILLVFREKKICKPPRTMGGIPIASDRCHGIDDGV